MVDEVGPVEILLIDNATDMLSPTAVGKRYSF